MASIMGFLKTDRTIEDVLPAKYVTLVLVSGVKPLCMRWSGQHESKPKPGFAIATRDRLQSAAQEVVEWHMMAR